MKATKQQKQNGLRVVLSLFEAVNGNPEHDVLSLELRNAVVSAMMNSNTYRGESEANKQSYETLLADSGVSVLQDQIRSIAFFERLLQARGDAYATKRDEVTASGHIDVTYRSVTTGTELVFALAVRVPLVLIDKIVEIYNSGHLVEEILEPILPPQPKVKKEPKPPKAAVREEDAPVHDPDYAPGVVTGGRDHLQGPNLPFDAATMLATKYERLSPREAAIYLTARIHSLQDIAAEVDHTIKQTTLSLQHVLNHLHSGKSKKK